MQENTQSLVRRGIPDGRPIRAYMGKSGVRPGHPLTRTMHVLAPCVVRLLASQFVHQICHPPQIKLWLML